MASKIPGAPPGQYRGEADLGDVTAEVEAAAADAFHAEWGRVVATLVRLTGDWDLAEECARGCLRHRPGALAPRRHPAPPRRLAHDRGAEPRRRPGAARQAGRRQGAGGRRRRVGGAGAGRCGGAGGPRTERRGRPRRPPAPDVHVLPPGALLRGPGGVDPPHAGRHDHRRDRPGLPRARADHGAAARAGETQDPPCGHPIRRSTGAPARRADVRRAGGPLPPLQRGLLRQRGRRPGPAQPDAPRPSGLPGCSAR